MGAEAKKGEAENLCGKLVAELKALGLAAVYFGCWLGALLLIKNLVLEEYDLHPGRMSLALVGALVLSKVVLILEHVPLGSWVRGKPAWRDVLLRTLLYVVGVVIVLVLEQAFEGRHEYGGFGGSLAALPSHANIYHVWANIICLTGALLSFNVLSVIRRHLGEGGLLRLFFQPLPE